MSSERIAVVTESVAVVPPHVARELGIHVVPLSFEIDGVIYRDGIDLTPNDFYVRLAKAKSLPHTSQPSPGVYLEAFSQLADWADHILVLSLSRNVSGTYQSAQQAARIFREDLGPDRHAPEIAVVDTGLAAVPQGLVAMEAARAVKAGAPWAEVLRRVHAVAARANMLVAVDTMEYLIRGGHVPKLAGLAATALDLKPLIQFHHGDPVPAGLARGFDHAFEVMLHRLEEERVRVGNASGRKARLVVGVMHAGAPERGERLLSLVQERLQPDECFLTDFTPVMGVHTGPGLAGVGYLVE